MELTQNDSADFENDVSNGNQKSASGEEQILEECTPSVTAETSAINAIQDAMHQEGGIEQMIKAIEAMRVDVQSLKESFDSKIRYDANKEHVIDVLHNELQTYREGLYFQLVRPIIFSLIGMHDDLTNLLLYNSEGEAAEQRATRLLQNLASFRETIESVLEKHGVIAFVESGSQFKAQRQRVTQIEPTDDPGLDRQVSHHMRKGFEHEGRVIRPESVVAYKYIETKEK